MIRIKRIVGDEQGEIIESRLLTSHIIDYMIPQQEQVYAWWKQHQGRSFKYPLYMSLDLHAEMPF